MGRDDWYRRTTWSATDRAEFYARLNRSRTLEAKAQYLCIQAGHLQETGDCDRIAAAVELLDDLVARFPCTFQLTMAHLQRAECLDALDRVGEAIESFRAAVAARRALPNVCTRVALVFGMFCIRRELVELLPEAEAYVVEFDDESPFPRDVFEANAVFAIARAQRGDTPGARAAAVGALAAARLTTSGLPAHSTLGLVDDVEPKLLAQLERLAG
ncbi:MAG: hypothetical protein IPL61_13020 [Myxococcales bacterium]|nr:hypothetical protein [Myxococcales bacterium]